MPKANPIQTNFTTGEVSPLMRGRVDTTRYANGADTISNFVVRPQGGLWRRSGTKFLRQVRTRNFPTILHEFEFSNIQAYLLEIGDAYISIFYNDGSNLFSPTSISNAVASAGLIKITSTTHGLITGDPVEISGVVGTFEANSTWVVTVIDANNFTLNGSTFTHAYVSGGSSTKILRVTGTPWTIDKLKGLSFSQSADVLFISHPDYQTYTLNRLGATNWTITKWNTTDGPYSLVNDNTNYFMQVTGYACTAKYFKVSGTSPAFVGGDVNKYAEYKEDGIWKLAKITAVTDADNATVDVIDNLMLGLDSQIILGSRDKNITVSQVPGRIHPLFHVTDAGAGVLASNYANTFSPSDVSSNVRRSDGVWCSITGYVDSSHVNFTALTMKATPGVMAVKDRVITGTLTCHRRTGSSTVTMFTSSDVGRHVRLNYSGIQCWGKITAFTSESVVTVGFETPVPQDVQNPNLLSTNGIATSFKLGAWSDTTGWPARSCFHEQRIVFARTNTEPQAVWMSVSGDFPNFSPTERDSTVLDDNAISYGFASEKVNAITWLQPGPVLLIGTIGGEWQVKAASSINEPLSPANISVTMQTPFGSLDNARVIRIGHSIIMIQRSRRKVIELTYSFEQDSWEGRDVTIISEHVLRQGQVTNNFITVSGIPAYDVTSAYQQEPHNLFWVLLSDGTLACMTYVKDQEVVAWHRHFLQGGSIQSICSVVSASGTEHTLFCTVKRTISGIIRVYIERFEVDFYPASQTDRSGAYHVDCGVRASYGSATPFAGNTWPVFSHLEGETVQVVKNGVDLGDFVVTNGSVTLASPATGEMIGGLKVSSVLRTLPPEGGSPFGTSQGKAKRIDKLDLRVYRSSGCKHGSDLNVLTNKDFDDEGNKDLITGDVRIDLEQSYGTDASYYITQDRPVPLVILSLMPHLSTQE